MSKELRHDRHTVSLLTDHMVFSPKYRGKVLVGDVAMLAEAIIRKTCKELDIEVIDMAVKPYSTASDCIKDALGQVLDYLWKDRASNKDELKIVVVGPSPPTNIEKNI